MSEEIDLGDLDLDDFAFSDEEDVGCRDGNSKIEENLSTQSLMATDIIPETEAPLSELRCSIDEATFEATTEVIESSQGRESPEVRTGIRRQTRVVIRDSFSDSEASDDGRTGNAHNTVKPQQPHNDARGPTPTEFLVDLLPSDIDDDSSSEAEPPKNTSPEPAFAKPANVPVPPQAEIIVLDETEQSFESNKENEIPETIISSQFTLQKQSPKRRAATFILPETQYTEELNIPTQKSIITEPLMLEQTESFLSLSPNEPAQKKVKRSILKTTPTALSPTASNSSNSRNTFTFNESKKSTRTACLESSDSETDEDTQYRLPKTFKKLRSPEINLSTQLNETEDMLFANMPTQKSISVEKGRVSFDETTLPTQKSTRVSFNVDSFTEVSTQKSKAGKRSVSFSQMPVTETEGSGLEFEETQKSKCDSAVLDESELDASDFLCAPTQKSRTTLDLDSSEFLAAPTQKSVTFSQRHPNLNCSESFDFLEAPTQKSKLLTASQAFTQPGEDFDFLNAPTQKSGLFSQTTEDIEFCNMATQKSSVTGYLGERGDEQSVVENTEFFEAVTQKSTLIAACEIEKDESLDPMMFAVTQKSCLGEIEDTEFCSAPTQKSTLGQYEETSSGEILSSSLVEQEVDLLAPTQKSCLDPNITSIAETRFETRLNNDSSELPEKSAAVSPEREEQRPGESTLKVTPVGRAPAIPRQVALLQGKCVEGVVGNKMLTYSSKSSTPNPEKGRVEKRLVDGDVSMSPCKTQETTIDPSVLQLLDFTAKDAPAPPVTELLETPLDDNSRNTPLSFKPSIGRGSLRKRKSVVQYFPRRGSIGSNTSRSATPKAKKATKKTAKKL